MTLYEQLTLNMKSAMKSGDRARVDVLRFVMAGIQGAQKDKNVKEPGVALTDDEVVALLQKEAKRRREAIALFRQGNREDLAAKDEADLAIIMEYVPKELSRAEIEKVVEDLHTQGFVEFNTLMKEAMKALRGRADGKVVGEVIKAKLG
jgi:uncharacterized protein YqeY